MSTRRLLLIQGRAVLAAVLTLSPLAALEYPEPRIGALGTEFADILDDTTAALTLYPQSASALEFWLVGARVGPGSRLELLGISRGPLAVGLKANGYPLSGQLEDVTAILAGHVSPVRIGLAPDLPQLSTPRPSGLPQQDRWDVTRRFSGRTGASVTIGNIAIDGRLDVALRQYTHWDDFGESIVIRMLSNTNTSRAGLRVSHARGQHLLRACVEYQYMDQAIEYVAVESLPEQWDYHLVTLRIGDNYRAGNSLTAAALRISLGRSMLTNIGQREGTDTVWNAGLSIPVGMEYTWRTMNFRAGVTGFFPLSSSQYLSGADVWLYAGLAWAPTPRITLELTPQVAHLRGILLHEPGLWRIGALARL